MAKTLTEKTAQKRQLFIERTARVFDISETQAAKLLTTKRQQSIRLNPLQGNPAQTFRELAILGWHGEPYPWMPLGFTNNSPLELVRDSAAVQEGRAFIQNAASWLPVLALDPHPGEAILDVCAAPGGKTSHVAAITNNQASITANDNSRARLNKMLSNFERLGVANTQTTLFDATQLAKKLHGQVFDKILLDAPCSGEGMMDLGNSKDFDTWSVAHIKRLQQLQKRLITQAWQLLRPGGTLVYSTCTIAPEENEAIINYVLRTHPEASVIPFTIPVPNRATPVKAWNDRTFDPRIQACLRLAPSPNIEAFFVCILQKSAALVAT